MIAPGDYIVIKTITLETLSGPVTIAEGDEISINEIGEELLNVVVKSNGEYSVPDYESTKIEPAIIAIPS